MPKLFLVVTEFCQQDGEIHEERLYVTTEDDSILTVTRYFKEHCEQYEKELKNVAEVATIAQHITED